MTHHNQPTQHKPGTNTPEHLQPTNTSAADTEAQSEAQSTAITSTRVRAARAAFGLPPIPDTQLEHNQRNNNAAWAALALDITLKPGQTALIIGPSGSGKSTILDRFLAATASPTITLPSDATLRATRSPIVDLFDIPLSTTLAILARAGLADPNILHNNASSISEGQRFRLRLALAMHALERAHRRYADRFGTPTLLADEFASTLDRDTAHAVARAAKRWFAAAQYPRLIAATAHDDIIEPLTPDKLIHVPLAANPAIL